MRRVITGTNAAGRSYATSDEDLQGDLVDASVDAHRIVIWGVGGAPWLPNELTEPPQLEPFWPDPGDVRCVVGDIPPGGETASIDPSSESDRAISAVMEAGGDGFHTTNTVDIVLVLSGNPVLELDEGEVQLNPGDVVIQNGTRHAWRNRASGLARIAVTVIGARRLPT